MTIYIISIILLLLVFATWFKEARIFLFLFHKLVFASRKGKALHIDRSIEFPESSALEKNRDIIYQELKDVMENNYSLPKFHEVDSANHKISFNNAPAWRTIVIKAYDGWFMNNCRLFPKTVSLLKETPSVSTVMFSILEPYAKIPPHRGKFCGILRYHLALAVPQKGACYIEINGEQYHWKEGEGILFNDTYIHSVTNNTDEYRIVLFLDVKKRASFLVERINNCILFAIRSSPVFKRAKKTGRITTG